MTPHPTPGNDGLMLAQCPFCGSPGQPIGIHGNLAHCPNKQCVLYSRKMYHIEWNTRAPTQPPAPVVPDVANMVELAAAAGWNLHANMKWDQIPEHWKPFYRENARASLEAVVGLSIDCPDNTTKVQPQ